MTVFVISDFGILTHFAISNFGILTFFVNFAIVFN